MRNNLHFLVAILLAGFIFACSSQRQLEKGNEPKSNENLVLATLYYQKAAEMKALSYQAYNIGRWQLDQILEEEGNPSGLAIVLDIDETVLDNSPYEAQTILGNFNYPAGWDDWINKASAEALPGAVDFLEYADLKGISIFYISNRREKYRESTMKNLLEKKFPQVTAEHLVLRAEDSGKEGRRQKVAENHQIVLLFGDNLSDFTGLFDGQSSHRRSFLADSLRSAFGSRFIVLPNPMYGDWLQALYDYDNNLTPRQKEAINRKMLKGF